MVRARGDVSGRSGGDFVQLMNKEQDLFDLPARPVGRTDAGLVSCRPGRVTGPAGAARGVIVALSLLCCVAAVAAAPDFTALVERHAPAVVTVRVLAPPGAPPAPGAPWGEQGPQLPDDHPMRRFFEDFLKRQPGQPAPPDPSREPVAHGSGFIVSADGHVITSHHTVARAGQIMVQTSDRREFVATLAGSDRHSDIALLKIPGEDLPVLRFGDSSILKVGQWVLAIGAPFGFNHSVTAGIISAMGRKLPHENYVPYLQTDAAVNRGNSGGPLFNLDGEVIGVNSQIYSPSGDFAGVSFAVPSEVVQRVYRQLRQDGEVRRGWLGVMLQDVTGALAESFQMAAPRGALVADVQADSPAARAGLQTGDIILRYDGQRISEASDLPPLVGSGTAGSVVPVQVLRAGERHTLQVHLGSLAGDDAALSPAPAEVRDGGLVLGMQLHEINAEQRARLQLPDYGVWVAQVGPGPGREAGIEPEDVLLLFDNVQVRDRAHLQTLLSELPADRDSVPVLVQRRGQALFLPLRLSAK